jgi:hypothetical protein
VYGIALPAAGVGEKVLTEDGKLAAMCLYQYVLPARVSASVASM